MKDCLQRINFSYQPSDSPAVIAPDADIQLTANRIAFGKFYNSGQICIAVDHVLCPKSKVNELVKALKHTLHQFYGNNPQDSNDYARIVNERHVERISALLNNRTSGEIAIGGEIDKKERYIAPTVVVNVKANDEALMGNEIFGPVLPIVTYNDIEEAIGIINQREPPLALYVFSKDQKVIDRGRDKAVMMWLLALTCVLNSVEKHPIWRCLCQ